jgi:hypothetical protein
MPKSKNAIFLTISVIVLVILAVILVLNRTQRFFEPFSAAGYIVYGVFIIAGLAALGMIIAGFFRRPKIQN